MNILNGLKRQDIGNYYYHRLFGVLKSYNRTASNLYVLAEQLNRNGDCLQELRMQQDAMSQRHYIARSFYRFFNINNYAFNIYLLMAHEVYTTNQQNQDGDIMSELEENILNRQERALVQGFSTLWNYSAQKIREGIWSVSEVISYVWNYFNGEITEPGREQFEVERIVTPEEDQQPVVETDNGKQFYITESMHEHLQVLGIDSPNGGTITWADVKAAYRQKALATHPDKGYLATDFHAVKNALDNLKELIFNESESNEDLSAQWDVFFREIIKEINRHCDNAERAAAETNSYALETTIYAAETKIYAAETKIYTTETKRYTVDAKKAALVAMHSAERAVARAEAIAERMKARADLMDARIAEFIRQRNAQNFQNVLAGAHVVERIATPKDDNQSTSTTRTRSFSTFFASDSRGEPTAVLVPTRSRSL